MMPGLGGIDPRKIDSMMKKMGIQNKNIEATKVIIETLSEKIIINNPSVTEVTMQGQRTFQIMGEVSSEKELLISEDDVSIVAESANVSKEQAKVALEENDGDLAQAIESLKE